MTTDLPKFKPLTILIAVVGVSYPFAVYFGLQILPPVLIGLTLMGFLSVRLFLFRHEHNRHIEKIALVLSLLLVALLLVFDSLLAIKSYPITISLSLAAVFGYSLIHPPCAIERIARLMEPNLNDKGVAYTRKVTIVWIIFFLINASISLMTAVWGDLEVWTFYNGFLSYLCVGIVFGLEFIVRQFVKKQHRTEE
jgi:uncharacterized membrane protein